ncbi:MAG: alpha/beta hydrolase [Christensenellaceae bacterium]|nr:alpha/beta hydrolase [Christensenellaceae bacterium]
MTERHRISYDGITMEYIRFGTGTRTMVILPGLSIKSVADMSEAVAAAYDMFTKDFTVYLFDRRENVCSSYDIYGMAHDTYTVMEHLGLHGIYLFGASQGGMIAALIAAEHPGFVRRLVLGNTSLFVPGGTEKTVAEWVGDAEKEDGIKLCLDMGRAIYSKDTFLRYEGMLADMGKTVSADESVRFRIFAGALKGFDMRSRASHIKCPVLSLISDDDGVFKTASPELAEAAFSGIGDIRFRHFDGYGHAAYDTAPSYREEMLGFFLS